MIQFLKCFFITKKNYFSALNNPNQMALNSFPDNYKSLQFNRLANSLALSDTSKKKNSNFQSTIAFLSLFVTLFLGNSVMGQVSITKPNLSIPVCSGFPSAYFNLDDIVIAETFTSDFLIGTDRKLILTIPTNFEFQAGTGGGTIAFNGNITSASISITTTTITITYTCTNTNKGDFITINGLKVRAINNASTGNITRTAGGISDGIINGLIVGTTLTNTLKSTIETPPTTANAGPMQTLVACATTATLAGNTPSSGTGIWTVVTGSATVTSPNSPTSGVTGLAIEATATLRWTISNGVCGSSFSDVTITTTAGPACLTYCTPTGNLNCTLNDFIKDVTLNTLNNINTGCSSGGYTNYPATGSQTTSLTTGTTYNLSITVGAGTGTHGAGVWFDFNQNGSFSDAGEFFLISNSIAPNATTTIPITIPIGAATGSIRMRIRYAYNITVASGVGMSCSMSGTYGETEDYTITLAPRPACLAPTAQPTTLSLNPTGNTISGSFILPSPLADNYLVVLNTTGITPTPVNGTTYTIGSTALGGTNVVVDTDGNNTFSASGLNASTTYYIYVFSFNSLCSGGPLYNLTSPLNGSTTTLTFCPASSTSSVFFISSFKTTGAVVDSPINTTGYSTTGYGNFTANAPAEQIPGGGINISLTLGGGIQYVKVWVDWNKNNVFDDPAELTFSSTTAFSSNTFGFVVPAGTAVGDYKMRIRSKKTDATFTSCNNEADGETEDYTIRIIQDCTAKITSTATVERCGEGTVTLSVTGTASTTSYKWYTAETGIAISGATSSTYTTPSLNLTTTYYVTALSGTCESLIRKPIVAKIKPIPNITITPENPEICGDKSLLEISAVGSTEVVDLFTESFEGSGLGGFTKINLANGTAATEWQQKTSVYPTTTVVWKPAISSGDLGNKFAFTTSDISGSGKSLVMVTTNNINTTSFIDLTLSFRHYFSYYGASDSAIIEVSTDGTNWTAVKTYTSSQGSPGKFTTVSIPLNTYIGSTTLKFRFRYDAGFCDGWAIDDVLLYGTRPLTSSFTWTGATISAYTDAAATIPYTNQLVNKVYIKPSLPQLEVTNWSFNANVQLINGCTATKSINVTNKSKVWQNSSPDWNNSNNWLPSGIPTADNCVIIPTGTNAKIINTPDAFAKNVTIKQPTGNLELQSGRNLTVTDFVNVETGGVFNVRNNASLVQITDADNNIGIVNIQRISKPMTKLDYTYWNSPIKTSSGFTLGNLSANSSHKYSWIPTVSNGSGNWQYESSSTVMDPRKGYIVRAPDNHTSGNSYTATFIGTPNNGLILAPISKGTNADIKPINPSVDDEDDEWNLIGNPYPSGLSITKFIDHPNNLNVVDGTVYIWMHNTQPSAATPDPFYGDYVLNYTSEDYATLNKTGATVTASAATTGGIAPTDFIASGQSFFIKSANTMPNGTTANATFNNSMRESGKNSSFAKKIASKEVEKNRIWLNLTNNSGAFSQILVGYLAEATQGLDRGFDGENLGGNDVTFYSIIPEAQLTIQGRALPFDPNDEVRLGYNSAIKGSLSIRIDHTDGLINTQRIYLEDKLLKIIHNLREKPYVFDTEEGDFNDRFVLRYRPSDKKTETIADENPYGVKVIVNQNVTVLSPNELIKNIIVYDMSGRKIDSYKKVDSFNFILNHLNKTTAGLILRITLDNNEVVSQKIFY